MKNSLEKLFNPDSIAILGASEDRNRIGGLTLHFLLRHGYQGRIYPVNPKYKTIRGLPCYAAITDIPDTVDLVLIGIPRAFVFDVGRACSVSVTEATLHDADLFSADEMFLTSTTREIVPIVTVNDSSIGDGAPGPVTRRLLAEFRRQVAAMEW